MADHQSVRPTVEDLLAEFRRSGLKLTPARRAVVRALVEHPGHPSADDLANAVADLNPDVHRASVYRTLDALTELGVVSHVHLGHTGAIYHFAGDTDLHVVCNQCGAVAHLDRAVLESARTQIATATGFDLDPGHFALPGRCPDCSRNSNSSASDSPNSNSE